MNKLLAVQYYKLWFFAVKTLQEVYFACKFMLLKSFLTRMVIEIGQFGRGVGGVLINYRRG